MRALKTITVAELIELLQEQQPDARVIVTADYGDYCHTPQALPLRGDIESVKIAESAYSASGYKLVDEDDDDDDDAYDEMFESGVTADESDVETFLVIR